MYAHLSSSSPRYRSRTPSCIQLHIVHLGRTLQICMNPVPRASKTAASSYSPTMKSSFRQSLPDFSQCLKFPTPLVCKFATDYKTSISQLSIHLYFSLDYRALEAQNNSLSSGSHSANLDPNPLYSVILHFQCQPSETFSHLPRHVPRRSVEMVNG